MAAEAPSRRDPLSVYAWILDSSIRLPGGFRVGLDGLIGLIPVVGDVIAALLSGGIVVHAFREGVSNAVILRMLGNIAFELVVGAIPIIGDVLDFVFKANERNVRLMQNYSANPQRLKRRSVALVAAVATLLLLLLLLAATALWQLLSLLLAAL